MPHAEVTVTLPPVVWIGALSREFPEATFRVLSAVPRDGDGFGLVEIDTGEAAAVLAAMEGKDAVTGMETIRQDGDGAVVQFETTQPLLLTSVQESGVPLSLPVEIGDGRARLELTASRDRIAALGAALERGYYDTPRELTGSGSRTEGGRPTRTCSGSRRRERGPYGAA